MSSMLRFISCAIVLFVSLVYGTSDGIAQMENQYLQTIRGDLLAIKGHVYVIRDISGRLVYLQVDKNTKQDRPLIPGERIEADVIPGERVVSLRTAK